jgi:hypothetical protein
LGAAAARETSHDGLVIVFNAGDSAVDFALPVPSPSMQWSLVFDTGDSVSSEQLRSADSAVHGPPIPIGGRRFVGAGAGRA